MTEIFQNTNETNISDSRNRLSRVKEKLEAEESTVQTRGVTGELGLIFRSLGYYFRFLNPVIALHTKFFHIIWFAVAVLTIIIGPFFMASFVNNNADIIFYDRINRRVQTDVKIADIIQIDASSNYIERVGQFGAKVFEQAGNLKEVEEKKEDEEGEVNIERFGPSQLMVPAPDPGLVESSPSGLLPIIGNDNRKPWQVYGRYFDPLDNRPKVAVVVTDLGFSSQITYAAIQMPGPTSLAFTPYIKDIESWVANARASNHEVFLMMPMEPPDYPVNDPGPLAIFEDKPDDENTQTILKVLGKVTGYVGIIPSMGESLIAKTAPMELLMNNLRRRGLAYIDTKVNLSTQAPRIAQKLGVPWTQADYYIQRPIDPDELNLKFDDFERIAKERGSLLILIKPYPILLNQINAWLRTLDGKDIIVHPASSVIASRLASRINRGFLNAQPEPEPKENKGATVAPQSALPGEKKVSTEEKKP